ncbi:hypothetical protein KR222_000794, partial [Zaprionus bogoriensis]
KEAKIKVKLNSTTGSAKQKYSQKFCQKWLSIFDPWLRQSADDPNKPFCRACQCSLDCNRCHLVRHERTTKHKRNLESLVTKGEGAVRKELSVRQERSKYYHQRKRALKELKQEPVVAIEETHPLEEQVPTLCSVNADGIGAEGSQATAIATSNLAIPLKTSPVPCASSSASSSRSSNKEGLKLLMQIQQDKNELMESFRDLIGVQMPQPPPPPREKNHVDLFFESVSSSVKALSPKLVSEAKMRVSQLICELELRALKDSNPTGGASIEMPRNCHLMAPGS